MITVTKAGILSNLSHKGMIAVDQDWPYHPHWLHREPSHQQADKDNIQHVVLWTLLLRLNEAKRRQKIRCITIWHVSRHRGDDMTCYDILQYCNQDDILQHFFNLTSGKLSQYKHHNIHKIWVKKYFCAIPVWCLKNKQTKWTTATNLL